MWFRNRGIHDRRLSWWYLFRNSGDVGYLNMSTGVAIHEEDMPEELKP